jgi:hypothetical protein
VNLRRRLRWLRRLPLRIRAARALRWFNALAVRFGGPPVSWFRYARAMRRLHRAVNAGGMTCAEAAAGFARAAAAFRAAAPYAPGTIIMLERDEPLPVLHRIDPVP